MRHTIALTPSPRQVIVSVMGGAWVIGYKAWSCRMGQVRGER